MGNVMESSQGVHFINSVCALLLIPTLVGCATSFRDPVTTGDTLAHEFRDNVVRLSTTWKDGTAHEGFGFIVGQGAEQIVVATANHVLRDMSKSPGEQGYGESLKNIAQTIDVRFFAQSSKTYSAELMGVSDRSIDLGAIRVASPPKLSWRKDVISVQRAERGTQVRFIGKLGKWEIPAVPGVVREQEPPFFLVEDLSISQGTSGAPLLSDTGLVGMVVSDGLDATRALPISTVAAVLQKAGPWQLVVRQPEKKSTVPTWVKIGGGILGAVAIGALLADDGAGDEESTGTINVVAPVP